MKAFLCILFLLISNSFMTVAWYGHLQFKNIAWLSGIGLVGTVVISWGLALFEYIFQVPANRIGFVDNGGPFQLFQLKIIQEVITLLVFTVFAVFVAKTDKLSWNHLAAFVCLILAVYFIFKK